MLISRFKTCSSNIKVKLFRSFLCNTSDCHLYSYKGVVVVFNKRYRKLFGIVMGGGMSAIYVNNNIDSFGTLVRQKVHSFKTRLDATS